MGVGRHTFFQYPFYRGLQQVIAIGGGPGQGDAKLAQSTQLRQQCFAL
jgi:hypothetical protein